MVPASQTTSLGVVLRGMLMGLAEVVPGVSGGTMAFITGIYQELVATLATFGPRSVTLLIKPRAFYEAHNLRFLFALGLGMGAGILMFAQVMHYLLNAYQPLVWAFFSGVIVMSAWVIGRPREVKALRHLVCCWACLYFGCPHQLRNRGSSNCFSGVPWPYAHGCYRRSPGVMCC